MQQHDTVQQEGRNIIIIYSSIILNYTGYIIKNINKDASLHRPRQAIPEVSHGLGDGSCKLVVVEVQLLQIPQVSKGLGDVPYAKNQFKVVVTRD